MLMHNIFCRTVFFSNLYEGLKNILDWDGVMLKIEILRCSQCQIDFRIVDLACPWVRCWGMSGRYWIIVSSYRYIMQYFTLRALYLTRPSTRSDRRTFLMVTSACAVDSFVTREILNYNSKNLFTPSLPVCRIIHKCAESIITIHKCAKSGEGAQRVGD